MVSGTKAVLLIVGMALGAAAVLLQIFLIIFGGVSLLKIGGIILGLSAIAVGLYGIRIGMNEKKGEA